MYLFFNQTIPQNTTRSTNDSFSHELQWWFSFGAYYFWWWSNFRLLLQEQHHNEIVKVVSPLPDSMAFIFYHKYFYNKPYKTFDNKYQEHPSNSGTIRTSRYIKQISRTSVQFCDHSNISGYPLKDVLRSICIQP